MASLPTLAEIKQALGIDAADTSKDAAITRTQEATISIIEGYCGRGLAYQAARDEFDPITTRDRVLFLFRFPVEAVTRVAIDDVDAQASSYTVHKSSGMVRWRSGVPLHLCCFERDQSVAIEYTGGYKDDQWPAALVDVVNSFFFWKWNMQGAGNVANASVGGAIKAASVDGLSITYADALGASTTALASAVIPAGLESWAAQLEPYRTRRTPGV